jgi:zinc protease
MHCRMQRLSSTAVRLGWGWCATACLQAVRRAERHCFWRSSGTQSGAQGSLRSKLAGAAALLGWALALAACAAFGTPPVAGDRVVRLPVADDPTISFRIWFEVGSQNDPPGKEGLAAITASMLAEGSTVANRYETILDRLFPLAGGYSASVSVEMTVLAGRIHKDNLERYYPLLMDAILQPAFRQEDLDRLKSQTLNYLENTLRFASDEDLGKAVLYNTIFAGTPYGHIPEGTIEAVRSIALDDVRAFYRRHYTSGNVVIGIGGGFEPGLVDRLRADLGRLPAGKAPAISPPQPKPIAGLHVTIVEKDDAPATAISLGYPISVLRGTREWYALAPANSWLGEHRSSSSHLYQVLREARGLNYGDYSYIEHFPNGGELQLPPQNVCRRRQIFEIWIRPVPNEARHFALRGALRELKMLAADGLAEDRFELTRKFLRNYVLHYASTTMERLAYALDDRFYGLDDSHLARFRRAIGELSRDEVRAAVQKHLQCENLHIVFVTRDGKALRQALVDDAPSPLKYPTPKPKSVLDEDRRIAVFPLNVKAQNVRIVRVNDLFVK